MTLDDLLQALIAPLMAQSLGQQSQQPHPFSMTTLSPEEEAKFQAAMQSGGYKQWADTFQQRFGESPNLNDPQYDYRAAWKAGIVPQPYAPDQDFPHWPSSLPSGQMLKAPDHPTAWMEHFMRQYGVDPNLASTSMIDAGRQQGVVPQDWQKLPPAPSVPSADDALRSQGKP